MASVPLSALFFWMSWIGCADFFKSQSENSTVSGLTAYCWQQGFNASCHQGEVIIMRQAYYGRMRRNHCLTSTAHIGCFADVLPQFDHRCSGHRHCKVSIPDTVLHDLQPCPKDMFIYIEASFYCQKVEYPTPHCSSTVPLMLPAAEGYISASSVTRSTDPIPSHCLWRVKAEPGQRINITLLEFTAAEVNADQSHDVCMVYAMIREPTTGNEVTVCRGGATRSRQVYSSDSHLLELLVLEDVTSRHAAKYLIKYQVYGCADPKLPSTYWYKRKGDTLTVHCNASSKTWYLYCAGLQWVGPKHNCTTVLAKKVEHQTSTEDELFPYSTGLVTAIVIGIVLGVLLGLLLLIVILVLRKRQRRRRNSRQSGADRKPAGAATSTHYSLYSSPFQRHSVADEFPFPPPTLDYQSIGAFTRTGVKADMIVVQSPDMSTRCDHVAKLSHHTYGCHLPDVTSENVCHVVAPLNQCNNSFLESAQVLPPSVD